MGYIINSIISVSSVPILYFMVFISFSNCLCGILSLKTDDFSKRKGSLIGLNSQVMEREGVDKMMRKDVDWEAFVDVFKSCP